MCFYAVVGVFRQQHFGRTELTEKKSWDGLSLFSMLQEKNLRILN